MGRVEVYRDQFEQLMGPFQDWPDLPCLICNRGALEPAITEFESKASADKRVSVEADDGPTRGFFHGEMACSKAGCGNRYVVAGEWTRGTSNPDEDIDELETYDPELFGFTVRYIMPSLPLISLPDRTPEVVKALVNSCSAVLLSDPNAASGRIRTAIEALLDRYEIRKMDDSRTRRLSIHARLQIFAQKESHARAAEYLIAVKWIGNEGAHEREPVPLRSVMDGLELFARAMEILYDPREDRLARLAAGINKRHDEQWERAKERAKGAKKAGKAAQRVSGSGSGGQGSSTGTS